MIYLLIALFLLPISANAEDMSYTQRMQMLQQMQHSRPNADNYINQLQAQKNKPASFEAGEDGHFYLPAEINGKKLEMMADTGATDIFLSREDAMKMGINVGALQYNVPYNTANGKVYAAKTVAKTFTVGGVTLQNVPVTVSQNSNSDMSLLGMEFFKRLSKYEVKDGQLTIYK